MKENYDISVKKKSIVLSGLLVLLLVLGSSTAMAATGPTARFYTDFSYTASDNIRVYVNQQIWFYDESDYGNASINSWSWDFGDGTTSTLRNPAHTYSKAGAYTVTLTVIDENGIKDKLVVEDFAIILPGADFSASPVSGNTPLKVQFKDASGGDDIYSWNWNFGDGTHSYSKNPTHTYTTPGSYDVSLTVTSRYKDDSYYWYISEGSSTTTKLQYINATASPKIPEANFTSNSTSGPAPLNVAFADQSTGVPTSWKWDFGDGATSTVQNPVHTYSAAGKYTVTLKASNANGTDTDEETDYINVTAALGADFSASPTSGNAPLKVTFTDKSTGSTDSRKWSFGDGTQSKSKNPVHTYSKPGIYSATLTVNYGNKPSSKVVPITVTALPVADFSMNPSSGYAPLLVQFTDKSTGATAWKWDFGDGKTSTKQSPSHIYSKAGTYTVTLKISAANGETSKVGTVNVLSPTLPVADFESNVKSGLSPLSVKFTDKSSGEPSSWLWDFGDGATSTEQNPTHKYTKAGTYLVSLTVTNEFGSDTVEEADYITVTSPVKLVADFSATPNSATPLKVQFTDKSTGTPTKWEWNFGDGTRSKSKNIAHTYKKAGTYTVTLKVTNANGATASKSAAITVSNVVKPVAAFSASPTSGKAPLTVKFTDKSTKTPTKWKWNFGDGSTSTEKNPTHKYSKAGKYTVTLTATNVAGSNTVTKSGYIVVK